MFRRNSSRPTAPRDNEPMPRSDEDRWSLGRRLLRLGEVDEWTIGDSFNSTQIFGDTGSGKTSGSGRAISRTRLKAGFGGLVLTDKSDETDRWRKLMSSVGRADDLVVFGPEQPHRFNVLQYEPTRTTRGGGRTGNIVELFISAMTVAEDGSAGGSKEEFWNRTLRQLLRHVVDLTDGPLESLIRSKNLHASPHCPRRHDQPKQTSALMHRRIQLCCQSAAGPAEAPARVGVLFFSLRKRRPVAAVGCAFTLVESSCTSSCASNKSSSCNARPTRSHTLAPAHGSNRFHTVFGLPKRSGRSAVILMIS